MKKKKQRVSDEKFQLLLIDEINKGNEDAHLKTNFFQLLQTKYSIDKTRSLRLWDKYYPDIMKRIEDAKNKETEKLAKKQVRKDIANKTERMIAATKILRGEELRALGMHMSQPTFSDSMRAAEYLSKIEGDFAAEEVNHTISVDSFLSQFKNKDVE